MQLLTDIQKYNLKANDFTNVTLTVFCRLTKLKIEPGVFILLLEMAIRNIVHATVSQ